MLRKLLATALAAAASVLAGTADAAPIRASPIPVPALDDVISAAAQSGPIAYVAGTFTAASPNVGGAAVLDGGTGDLRHGLPAGNALDVRVVIGDGAGGWYLGGSLGTPAPLVHLHEDGLVSSAFQPDLPQDAEIAALALHRGRLYVGGNLDRGGGRASTDVVALDPVTGTADAAFDVPMPVVGPDERQAAAGGNTAVTALAVAGDALWVGRLSAPGGPRVAALTRVDLASGAPLPAPAFDGDAVATLLAGQGRVYVVEGMPWEPGSPLAYDADTAAPIDAFDPQLMGLRVRRMALADGVLYAAGDAGHRPPGQGPGVLALNPLSGAPVPGFDGPPLDHVTALAVDDGRLYVAAEYVTDPSQRLSAVDPRSGRPISGFDARLDATPSAVAIGDDGSVLVAGRLASAGGRPQRGLAAVDLRSGALVSGFAGPAVTPARRWRGPCALTVAGPLVVARVPGGGSTVAPCSAGRLAAYTRASGELVTEFRPRRIPRLGSVHGASDRVVALQRIRRRVTRVLALDLHGRRLGTLRRLHGAIAGAEVVEGRLYLVGRFRLRRQGTMRQLAVLDVRSGRLLTGWMPRPVPGRPLPWLSEVAVSRRAVVSGVPGPTGDGDLVRLDGRDGRLRAGPTAGGVVDQLRIAGGRVFNVWSTELLVFDLRTLRERPVAGLAPIDGPMAGEVDAIPMPFRGHRLLLAGAFRGEEARDAGHPLRRHLALYRLDGR